MMPKGLRILLADDHPLMLAGVSSTLQHDYFASQIALAHSASAIIQHLEKHPCDLLITDYSMPDARYGDGLKMLDYLRRNFPELRIVVLTLMDNPALLRSILMMGVYGLVSKKDASSLILNAVQAAIHGTPYQSPSIAEALASTSSRRVCDNASLLSKRENEVLRLYAEGLSVTEISQRLKRSVKTISSQKKGALNKLGIEHDADLFRYVFESGLWGSTEPAPVRASGHK